MRSIAADDTRAAEITTSIHAGNLEALERHLREDPALATARVVDDRGVARTLLHIVADWPGHFPNGAGAVAVLAAAGADVDAAVLHAGPHGSAETSLHWAASSDDVAVIDALLDAGADIEAPGAIFTGGTAMSDAVVFAQWRAARRLLERGAATTIWQAAALGLVERVRELCASDPRPTVETLSNALWHACRGGQRGSAEMLLADGAVLNRIGHEEKTPYDVAHESGDAALVEWLAGLGARRAAELS
ncbi:MAG: ankyrin repeat domain-containing protein [Gemmatimonadota bacterium]